MSRATGVDDLRSVQAAKRAGLRVATYLAALESFTDDDGDGGAPPTIQMSRPECRAVENIHTAAARLTGDTRPPHLRELVQSVADRHGLRLADVLRLDVLAFADLAA